MKHIKTISTVARADAFVNFLNALWRDWQTFRYEKKNELSI
ncbi:MAG TPA: hypothetical protein PLI09_20685 [Candidatus Hydrogenedentes bacterium]|nr:hypothetical protein [Candidatus Hydrogenedentota bacterium]